MVDGSSEYEGRVEIYQKGRWGSLCKPLSHVEASYICRHLGYLGGIASEPGYFGEGSGVFWDMNFTCLLSRQCSIARSVLDSSLCDHKYDAGVICGETIKWLSVHLISKVNFYIFQSFFVFVNYSSIVVVRTKTMLKFFSN